MQGLRAGGRSVKLARSGETVEIDLPEGPGPAPAPGTEVRHLSSRSLDLPAPREGAYPAWRMPVEVAVEVRGRVGAGSLGLRAVGAATAEIEQEVTLVEAREPRAFAGIVTPVLGESGTSLFRASASSVTNRSDLADDRIFVPPSELKRARSRLYEALDADFLRRVAERSAAASRGPTPMPHLEAWPAAGPAPDRASLSPRGRGPIPFARRCGSRIETAGLARCDGAIVVPLPTFMPDAAVWSEAVSALASERPGERLLVGIGNVAHAAIARALDGRPNVSFFIDFHLYVANRWTVSLLARLVRPLAFAFSWIEGDERDRKALEAAVGPGLLPVGPGFRAPLFYSRGCYAKHVLFGGRCPADCAKEFAAELRQGQATFEVQVRDCMTYVFGDAGAPGDSAGGHSDSSGSS